jgi:hypothetical protein
MTPTDQLTDMTTPPSARPRLTAVRGRATRGAGVAAVALALALAGCGGDDDGGSTTAASAGETTEQTATPTTAQTTETAADNGIADKTPEEAVVAAQEAARAATAVRVVGRIDDVGLELSLVRGRGATGSMSQGDTEFELTVVDDEVYLKGSDAFYRQIGGDAAVQLLSGRWLQVPATDDDFRSIAQFGDMEILLRQALDPESDRVTAGEVTDVDGQPALPLSSTDGTLYVATTGEPLPLKLVGGRDRRGEIAFTDWNEPVDLTAPADAVDIGELQRGGSSN